MSGWPRVRSAGSFFKNPVVPKSAFERIHDELERSDSTRRWYWPQHDGAVKISAGRLIEGAGFKRGFRDGPAGNSPHHSLSLIAYRGAGAADVVSLAKRIQESVAGRFRIVLDVEPQLWGWNTYPLLRPEPVEGLRS